MGWESTTVSLCSWHVIKDVRKRLQANRAENVFNRTSHGWSFFAHDSELAFFQTDWLEKYRAKRQKIIEKRLQRALDDKIPLNDDETGTKEPTVLDRKCIEDIINLMIRHLHWHPFKAGRKHVFPGREITSRAIWLWQAKEMHDLCGKYGEGFAWEYLWKNWYDYNKWILWARSADLNYYPVIQTNGPVEVHWKVVKHNGLAFIVLNLLKVYYGLFGSASIICVPQSTIC